MKRCVEAYEEESDEDTRTRPWALQRSGISLAQSQKTCHCDKIHMDHLLVRDDIATCIAEAGNTKNKLAEMERQLAEAMEEFRQEVKESLNEKIEIIGHSLSSFRQILGSNDPDPTPIYDATMALKNGININLTSGH